MFGGDVKLAIKTLRTAKWRSLLTMLGIIIGVVSVVTIVSLGEGVKKQVANQIDHLGGDLITVRPGSPRNPDSQGNAGGVNVSYGLGFGIGSLSEDDMKTVRETNGVNNAVPLAFVTGTAKLDNHEYSKGYILGTNPELLALMKQKVEFGSFFTGSDVFKHVAVIGKGVAESLFEDNVPIGRTFTIRGQDFIVRGIFEPFTAAPLSAGIDFNSSIFIPYEVAKEITSNASPIIQIWAKPATADKVNEVVHTIDQNLLDKHGNQHDFTVLKASDSLAISSNVLNVLTGFIAGIAAISLLVGGIGIMNIMLVSVTERTREIGIRKAIGATNRQLLKQFLVEALVLSFIGGLFGILGAGIANLLLRIFTDFTPVLTFPIIALASGVSIVVGVIFGIAPALRAAHKDPIEALRNE